MGADTSDGIKPAAPIDYALCLIAPIPCRVASDIQAHLLLREGQVILDDIRPGPRRHLQLFETEYKILLFQRKAPAKADGHHGLHELGN